MPTITLPDGTKRNYEKPVSPATVASDIGPGLGRAALAAVVDEVMWDLNRLIDSDVKLSLITAKDDAFISLLRHDCAHVMAEAVLELFPETQVTIGPAIENGFYYDFCRQKAFSEDDLAKIEKRMHEIVDRDEDIIRSVSTREEAIEFYKKNDEPFKTELVEAIPVGETVTFYKQGNFIDLCRGPHLPSTGRLGHAFKLMKVAGAYWRGDSARPMLQRIYGTAWKTEKELEAYLNMLQEAEKRDHRRLGREMDLFHFEDVAPGSVFWHPRGWRLFQELIGYMRKRQETAGYVEVNSPDIMDRALWETSGHWQNYRENMFLTKTEDNRDFALKPMNCPGHMLIYGQGIKSYRDLPVKISEFGKVHRYEPSGALHGLMRVRSFTQDDAHIYCAPEQLTAECLDVNELVLSIYRDFGFEDVRIKLSTRPENRIGNEESWDRAEDALKSALDEAGHEYTIFEGEGAFYGPKLEYVLRDAIGRDWQCGTLQVDFNLPERFGTTYVASSGDRLPPVMLHRALFGSLERFTGILIEHYSGRMPVWLAPVQIVVASITDQANTYAQEVFNSALSYGLRVEMDLRNEKIGYKVREHSVKKIPFILAVGERESKSRKVAMRRLGSRDQQIIDMAEALSMIQRESLAPYLIKNTQSVNS